MKNAISKISNIPAHYTISICLVSLFIIVSLIQRTLNLTGAITFSLVGIFILLTVHRGFSVIKTVFFSFIIIYLTAVYTSAVIEIEGKVIEPFALTLGSVTIFLAQSYSSKYYNFYLRSKAFWSAFLTFVLVSVKLSLILSGFSIFLTEMIGLNVLVVFILLWRWWTNFSKKTKIIEPTVTKREESEEFVIITIKEEYNLKDKIWKTYKAENAYPYVFSEVLKAHQLKKKVILVSESKNSNLYEVGRVKINKNKSIPYMYMEPKTEKHLENAIKNFKIEK